MNGSHAAEIREKTMEKNYEIHRYAILKQEGAYEKTPLVDYPADCFFLIKKNKFYL